MTGSKPIEGQSTYLRALRHALLGTVDLHIAATHPEPFVRQALCMLSGNPGCSVTGPYLVRAGQCLEHLEEIRSG